MSNSIGVEMHGWAKDLWTFPRSLTGNGVRETLAYLSKIVPSMTVHEVPSGTQAFDWTVPDEWNIRGAYIEDQNGNRVVDFARNNLHVVGYSTPVDQWMTLDELQPYLHSLPEQPGAIPYITSYYVRRWGFCLAHAQREQLAEGKYRVVIDSALEPGSLTYGEILIPGREEKEVFLSTYICHPSMANNELSGPVVTTALARWISSNTDRRFSYRIVFIPETIGSIVYISRHLDELKKKIVAGYVVSCVGDDRAYSLLRSRAGNTVADRAAKLVLKKHAPDHIEYTYLDRGSDERQYCSPGVDLPVASMMRTRYNSYPEYHTSLDDLTLVTPSGLEGAFHAYTKTISLIEKNRTYRTVMPCEPQLGKRGLYPTLSTRGAGYSVRSMTNVLAYADGTRDLVDLAETIGITADEAIEISEKLVAAGLIAE
jgi:aminopeptidase-like protein